MSVIAGALIAAGVLLLILWLGLLTAAVLSMRAEARGGTPDKARLKKLARMRIGASLCLIVGMGLIFLGVFVR